MKNFNSELPSNKKFGISFSFIFLFISIYLIFYENNFYILSVIISIFLLIISFIKPNILNKSKNIWMKLGYYLNLIVSPVIMFIIFSIAFCSIGFILKILRKDLLNVKIDSSKKSYWNLPDDKMGTMKNIF